MRTIVPPIYGINTESDGNCRAIRAVYYKVSSANFWHTDGRGATGAIEIYER